MLTPDRSGHYTTKEAADLLDVTIRTIQLWVERGVLQAWRTPGGHRRVAAADVDRLLAERLSPRPAVERVLIVEDDPDQARLLRLFVLAVMPEASVDIVHDGLAAMLGIGRAVPHLVLLDLIMPHMDGFQMLRVLREDAQLAALNIVVVSSLDAEEIERRGGLPPGVYRVLQKPVDFEAIKDTLKSLFRTAANKASVSQ